MHHKTTSSAENNQKNGEQEINIAVHLGKNSSYQTANNSAVKIYQFNKTMPNFFASLAVPLPNYSNISNFSPNTTLFNESEAKNAEVWLTNVTKQKSLYRNATKVLVYQHEPGGYLTRDCMR